MTVLRCMILTVILTSQILLIIQKHLMNLSVGMVLLRNHLKNVIVAMIMRSVMILAAILLISAKTIFY